MDQVELTDFDEDNVNKRRRWKVKRILHSPAGVSREVEDVIEADFVQLTQAGHLAFFNYVPNALQPFSEYRAELIRAFAWYTELELLPE